VSLAAWKREHPHPLEQKPTPAPAPQPVLLLALDAQRALWGAYFRALAAAFDPKEPRK
jgi:hypothetical protein